MQRLQRRFGAFLKRTPNETDVAEMLREFNEAEAMLGKIADAAKAWREAWTNILIHQQATAEHLLTLYKPLGAKGFEASTHVPAEIPQATVDSVEQLHVVFAELKTDMMEELKEIETKLIVPAEAAKDSLKPTKKTIKKREDKKLDYERYQSRVDALQKKTQISDRERTALAKHEMDLQRTTYDYQVADENLRSNLPRINAAVFSLLPHLLAIQITIQNNLIGNLYTVLNQYSSDHGFPNPPPELDEVIPVHDANFTSFRLEVESHFDLIAKGKAVHQPMRLQDQGSTVSGLGIRNRVMPGRRTSSQSTTPTITATSPRPDRGNHFPPTNEAPPINLSSKPSLQSLNATKPKIGSTSPGLYPYDGGSSIRRTSTASSVTSNGTSNSDYFARPRIPSSSATSSPALGKKKPPPPPPKKIGSWQGEYVTAMYDFEGQGEGDLSFREGDRIRVVKKTESSQDWWEGELRGVKGSFPANYCR